MTVNCLNRQLQTILILHKDMSDYQALDLSGNKVGFIVPNEFQNASVKTMNVSANPLITISLRAFNGDLRASQKNAYNA